MNSKLLRKIAGVLVLVLLLGCFSGCKNNNESGVGGVVDMNGVAGNEIEIDIPDAPVKDEDDGNGQQNNQQNSEQNNEQNNEQIS